jgi:hypothetical protein
MGKVIVQPQTVLEKTWGEVMSMVDYRLSFARILRTCLLIVMGFLVAAPARACPFCSATQQTLGEELQSADAAVLAELIKAPPPYDPNQDNGASFRGLDPETNNATFRIVEKLRGGESLVGIETIEVPFFGQAAAGKVFLITGIRTDRLDWTTPLPLSDAAEGYVRKLLDLPPQGADRLEFFQDYLEHDDPMLAQDAYDEFARAPYDAVIALREKMHHDRLVEWIHDVEIAPSRRRLYLTMLGVCGTDGDLPMLEYYMSPTLAHNKAAADVAASAGLALTPQLFRPALYELAERYERLKKQGLDAMIACYLTLKGAEGLPLIEDLFLKDPNGDFKEIFSAIYALRFHGEETDVIPRERLLSSMRLVLDNPTFADQVIADLSRWEDWGVMDRLAKMFQEADKTSYVRQPIATYMLIASEQEGEVGEKATRHLETLRQADQEAVDDAERNLGFGLFARAIPQGSGSSDSGTDTTGSPALPAQPDAPSSSPSERDIKVAQPTAGNPPVELTVDTPTGASPADEIPEPTTSEEPRADVAATAQPSAEPQAGGADATESQPVADSDPDPRQVARTADQARANEQRPFSPPEDADSVSPPSRLAIVGGTLVAVVVLVGLFAILLRGIGNKTA